MMRIAIPNKGVLCQPALDMLAKAGFASLDKPTDTLCARCEDVRVEYLFVRAQDVARYVDSGAAYAGITGEDMLLEGNSSARKAVALGFGECEIALAVPEGSGIKSAKGLAGKRVATKLPNISRKYLASCGVKASVTVPEEEPCPPARLLPGGTGFNSCPTASIKIFCNRGKVDKRGPVDASMPCVGSETKPIRST